MQIEKERVEDILIARIREPKITSHEAPEMKTALLELVIDDYDKLLVSLKDVDYMDSTGLGSFLFGLRQADQHGKDMRFCEIQPKIRFLIRIAHLEDVIDVYETEQQALDDFKNEGRPSNQ